MYSILSSEDYDAVSNRSAARLRDRARPTFDVKLKNVLARERCRSWCW